VATNGQRIIILTASTRLNILSTQRFGSKVPHGLIAQGVSPFPQILIDLDIKNY
jgi:hypothetical protein